MTCVQQIWQREKTQVMSLIFSDAYPSPFLLISSSTSHCLPTIFYKSYFLAYVNKLVATHDLLLSKCKVYFPLSLLWKLTQNIKDAILCSLFLLHSSIHHTFLLLQV